MNGISPSVVRNWIKKYNEGELKEYTPCPEVYSMKSRKTTFEERIQIVKWVLDNNNDYKGAASQYAVPYSLVYQWTKKYLEKGKDALKDSRGRPSSNEHKELTELEKKDIEIEIIFLSIHVVVPRPLAKVWPGSSPCLLYFLTIVYYKENAVCLQYSFSVSAPQKPPCGHGKIPRVMGSSNTAFHKPYLRRAYPFTSGCVSIKIRVVTAPQAHLPFARPNGRSIPLGARDALVPAGCPIPKKIQEAYLCHKLYDVRSSFKRESTFTQSFPSTQVGFQKTASTSR